MLHWNGTYLYSLEGSVLYGGCACAVCDGESHRVGASVSGAVAHTPLPRAFGTQLLLPYLPGAGEALQGQSARSGGRQG